MKKKTTIPSSSVDSPFIPNPSTKRKKPFEFGPFGYKGCAKRLKFRAMDKGETSRPQAAYKGKGKAAAFSSRPAEAQVFFDDHNTVKTKTMTRRRVREVHIGPNVKSEPQEDVKEAAAGEKKPEIGEREAKEAMDFNHITVVVSSTNATDMGAPYRLSQTTPFDLVYTQYAALIDVKPTDIVIMKARRIIIEECTLASTNIVNHDALTVYPVGGNFNTDSQVKEVVIRQCHKTHNDPIRLQVRAPLTQTMDDFHGVWAHFMQVKKNKLSLVKNMKKVKRTGTVETNKIKNGDNFYTVPPEDEYDDDYNKTF